MYGFGGDQSKAFSGAGGLRARRPASRSSSPTPASSTRWSAAGSRATTCRTSRSSRSRASCWTSPSRASSPDLEHPARHRRSSRRPSSPACSTPAPRGRQGLRRPRCRSTSRAWSGTRSRRSRPSRLQGPDDQRRAARPHRPDQGRRHHAVVHRHRVRPAPPAGRPPTGSRTTSCASAAPRRTTSGSSTRSRSTTRSSSRPGTSSRRSRWPRATCSAAAERSSAPPSPPRRTRCSRPAECFLHRQASFLAQTGFFPDEVRQTWTTRSVCSSCPARTASDKPVIGGGDLAGRSARTTTPRRCWSSSPARVQALGRSAGGFISPHKDFDLSNYPNETTADRRDRRYGTTDFRVRRLRPDARRGRRGQLLAGDGRLGQRPEEPRTTP